MSKYTGRQTSAMKLSSVPGQHRLFKWKPRKKSSQGKLKLASTLKRNQAEAKWKIQHSLVYSCDTWCPPKIVQDFKKNLCSWNGKDLSAGDEIEKEPTTWSLSWNITAVLDIGAACAGGAACRLPPGSCQTQISPHEVKKKAYKLL